MLQSRLGSASIIFASRFQQLKIFEFLKVNFTCTLSYSLAYCQFLQMPFVDLKIKDHHQSFHPSELSSSWTSSFSSSSNPSYLPIFVISSLFFSSESLLFAQWGFTPCKLFAVICCQAGWIFSIACLYCNFSRTLLRKLHHLL